MIYKDSPRIYKNFYQEIEYIYDNAPKYKEEDEDCNLFYTLRFIDKQNNTVFYKIGSTHRGLNTRAKQCLRSYEEKYPNIEFCEVLYTHECLKDNTLVEDYIRTQLRLLRLEYLPTDRFLDMVPIEKIEKMVKEIEAL